jgi:Zn-dependent protease with chaperone function
VNFIEQQKVARRNTSRLILYFVAGVLGMIVLVYVLVAALFLRPRHGHVDGVKALWDPVIFCIVGGGTIAVVVVGSLIKIHELAHGGSALAMRMGGHQLNPNSKHPDERKLLNVVEEMAIASGVPVPPVYLLGDEQGINAFAAGDTPHNAVIGVTRGTLMLLRRDEMQGVIAHEFSHILNGDMRLNMRLIGWVFGILCLTIVGKILLRSGGRRNALPLAGLVLVAVGSVGAFFGRLIQSAVSRQREFLADASAVQFTRNPEGLAGALKKIGGLSGGSRLSTQYADEAGHFFFGNALAESWLGWLATHPPLAERIRRIDPQFDGKFPLITIATAAAPPPLSESLQAGRRVGLTGVFSAAAAGVKSVAAANALSHVGQPLPDHLARAGGILAALPEMAVHAAREPFDANALIYAMLLSSDTTAREAQLASLRAEIDAALIEASVKLLPAVADLERDSRLALAKMAMPALRRLTSAQYEIFTRGIQRLIEADQQIDLFEYVLQKLLKRNLESHFRPGHKPVVQYYVLKPLVPDCVVLLSALSRAGQEDEAGRRAAFLAGATRLGLEAGSAAMFAAEECSLPQIDLALRHLGEASPAIKIRVLDACAHAVASDGFLQVSEAELLRAVADTLDCPIPPFIERISE